MLWIGLPRRKAAPRNDSQAMLNFHSGRPGRDRWLGQAGHDDGEPASA
jgi:hypothetical protein